MASTTTTQGGPIGKIPDPTTRHQAIRGLILTAFPSGFLLAGKIAPIVPSVADLHAIQCVGWVLSKYGTAIGGWNWGAPVKDGDCKGSGITIDDDGVCVTDFFRNDGNPGETYEMGACMAFIGACMAQPTFTGAANRGDAAAVAMACGEIPFYPGLLPQDLEDASTEIGQALGESPRLKFVGAGPLPPKQPPGQTPPGGLIPSILGPFAQIAAATAVPWTPILVIGGVVAAAAVGGIVYTVTRKPKTRSNPRRRSPGRLH